MEWVSFAFGASVGALAMVILYSAVLKELLQTSHDLLDLFGQTTAQCHDVMMLMLDEDIKKENKS